MGSLKERLVSVTSSAMLFTAIACNGPKSIEDLVRCNEDKDSQSTPSIIFLKDGEKTEVNGWTIQVSKDGSFVMMQEESKDQESIRVDPTNAVTIQPRKVQGIFNKSDKAYTVSGKPASSDGNQGTELIINVHCK